MTVYQVAQSAELSHTPSLEALFWPYVESGRTNSLVDLLSEQTDRRTGQASSFARLGRRLSSRGKGPDRD